jgi:hypothetical protein
MKETTKRDENGKERRLKRDQRIKDIHVAEDIEGK